MKSNILGLFSAILLFSLCTCRDHPQNSLSGILNLDHNLNFSWTINTTSKTIRFKVNAVIHESGWLLIGYQPQKGKAPEEIGTETRGDAFVVWSQTSKEKQKHTWKVIDCNTFNNGTLQRDKHKDYYLAKSTYVKKNSTMLTAIVWRHLDTKDKEDVVIKQGPMFVFGSYGNDNPNKKWKKELEIIKGGIVDVHPKASAIHFFRENSLKAKGSGRNFVKYAEKLAEQHWIGLVVGLSAFFTILITCTVYCIAKKGGGIKKKHITMSFNKESEYDDEAKVAFLQSEET